MAATLAPQMSCGDLSKPPSSRLQRTGLSLVGGGSQRMMSPASQTSEKSWTSGHDRLDLGPPAPPSGRTGIMFSNSAPTLTPNTRPAENVRSLHNVRMRRQNGPPEGVPKAVWTDGCSHLGGEEPWPHNAVPLWVFTGRDRPRPGYREEIQFTLRDEKYINFAVRIRCGTGDHYSGGSIGIVHSPDRSEAAPGTEGQLIMITDVCVQPNNSVIVSCIGDVGFRVKKSWMPRGMQGLQLAHVEVDNGVQGLDTVIETCATEPNMTLFARMIMAVPHLASQLSGSSLHTVFVPTDEALMNLGMSENELLERPDLEALVKCHIVPGKVSCANMYSGRTLQASDGSILQMTFARWPRGLPSVNEVPVEHLDVLCSNGVIHTIVGLLTPAPAPGRRRR